MKEIPNDYKAVSMVIMSNFDHEIDYTAVTRLQREKVVMDYPGWNFHAQVWFQNEKFYGLVRRYHSHVDTIEADTIEELRNTISDQYGWD